MKHQDIENAIKSVLSIIPEDSYNVFLSTLVQEVQVRRKKKSEEYNKLLQEIEQRKNELKDILKSAEISNPQVKHDNR